MILSFFLLILLLTLSVFRVSAHEYLSLVANKSHLFCIENLPRNSTAYSELKALVCAENFSTLAESQIYISSGLIHLFVVSGAHFIVLEKLLMHFFLAHSNKRWIILLLFLGYGLMCNLNPPVTRSLFSFVINYYFISKNVKWPHYFKIFIVGLVTLIFNPNWIDSLSLQMSWLAALSLSIKQDFFKKTSLLTQHIIFFITLYPLLIFFQIPNATNILTNFFLAPLLEFVLFPTGLLVWLINELNPLFELLILNFKFILTLLSVKTKVSSYTPPLHFINYIWSYIFLIHFLFHFLYLYKNKNQHE